MAEFPTSIDDLISHVERLHPSGAPLDHVAAARDVSSRLIDQADELLGYFVDRARRSGQSWTEIGARMGVSKQAVRKRFVPRWDGSDPIPQGELYSRSTLYARRALLVANATAQRAGAASIDVSSMAVALLNERHGLGAKIIASTGITGDTMYTAVGVSPAECDIQPTARLLQGLQFTEDATVALYGARDAALRLGHNYIGTEHFLLGILSVDCPTSQTLTALGLNVGLVEDAVNDWVARIQEQGRIT